MKNLTDPTADNVFNMYVLNVYSNLSYSHYNKMTQYMNAHFR